jgi:hypothetical protein
LAGARIILFCNQHHLTPSIKAGGYGTSGVSIGGSSRQLFLRVNSSHVPRYQSLGDVIVDLSRLRGISIDLPDNAIPREYVGLRDPLSPTDKGKGKARPPPPQTTSAPNLKDADAISTTSTTSQKRRREAEEAEDDEEKAAYNARLKRYDPAAPRVSSFLSGPPLVPVPDVSRRLPPQDYRASRLDATNSTGSEAASTSIDTDSQHTDRTNPTTTLESRVNDPPSVTSSGVNPPPPQVAARGPFDHINLVGGPDPADTPRSTPWLPTRVRPFDYLATAGPLEDTGPIQQPTYQQSMHSSRGLASFSTFASNTPFPSLDIPHHLSHPMLNSAVEDSSFPTSASSLLSSYPSMDWENPPLDHRPQLEPRFPHVYVTFGAGVLQKEIDMHTADNPVESKESADGTVGLIPYHVPTCVRSAPSSV